LQGDTKTDKKHLKVSDWASELVTTMLQQVICLWETRNEELHGKTQTEQNVKLLNHQRQTIAKMIALKDQCQARDRYIFPNNETELLQETSTSKLANWIATRKQLIKQSIKQAIKSDTQHTNPITKWFSRPTQIEPDMHWHRNRLLHDPYNKKKRHKQPQTQDQPLHQTLLSKFFP